MTRQDISAQQVSRDNGPSHYVAQSDLTAYACLLIHACCVASGKQEWEDMSAEERLDILLLLLGFLGNSRAVRDLLLEDEEKRKDMRREIAAIRAHRAQQRK